MIDSVALVASWSAGGEKELANALLPHVRTATDGHSSAALYDAFHTLIAHSISSLCQTQFTLKPSAIAAFLHKLVQALPSSSTGNAPEPATASAIDETIVDVLWAIDAHIDDNIQDAVAVERAANAPKQQPQDGTADDTSDRLARAKAKRAKAEADRATVAEVLKLLLQNTVVQLATCRARLDFGLLLLAGLVQNKVALEKKEVQTKTRLFYRQNKFNLLREQSEGYTKLSVELTASIGPAHSHEDAKPVEAPELIRARALEVWDKVVSLVGYFDLDPNRVLDIILDVFSCNIFTHYSFFLELLRCSPWAGDACASTIPSTDDVDMDNVGERSKYGDLPFDDVLRVARGLPPRSAVANGDAMDVDQSSKKASVCAQVLGFKFAYFQTIGKMAPRTLSFLAAFLIRERVITLEDLLPHLLPEDDEMKKDRENFDKDILERISNARSSALALAAPLAADEPIAKPRTGTSSSDAKKKDDAKSGSEKNNEAPKEPNHKVTLLHALLALGALEPAFEILSYAPWLASASPEVAELLLRVAHHSLNPLYESTVNRHERYRQAVLGAKMKFSPNVGLVPPPAKKMNLTSVAPTPPSTAAIEFVYFYPQWKDLVPLCAQPSDIKDVLEPLLRFIGVQVYRDTEFMTKLCRVGKTQACVPNVDPAVAQLWVQICRLYLLPGMSLLNNNTTISAEIWPILRAMDATTRWGLYGEWGARMYKGYPEMRVRKVEAEREAKAIMRRLSTKTVMTLNRNVAKLAHSNPCVLFAHMVNQVQAYDNMAEVVVESLKFCALMPFDVMLYTVLETLANPNKDRLKDDGISVSQWLQSLSSFIGLLCRRYHQVDCSLILRYVVNRLRNEEVMEIIVLRELIGKMTGMQPPENLSEQQVMALSGGPILRVEAVASETRGIMLEKPILQTRAMERLISGLNTQGMAKALLVLTARQRGSCLFKSKVQHLKSLSTLYDSVQQIHFLFIECLATGLSSVAYSALLPSYRDLCRTYHVDPYTAIQMYRPKLHQDIVAHVLALKAGEAKESAEEVERRLKAALAAKREPSGPAAADVKAAATTDASKGETDKDDKPLNGTSDSPMDVEPSPWLPLLDPVIKDAEEVLGPRVIELMGAPFFVTFWQLSLYDLNPPGKRYDEERSRHRTLLKQTSDAINDPLTKSARVRELKVRKERIATSSDALAKEYSTMASNREFTLKRLAREHRHWFPNANARTLELVAQILQHCIVPRALVSPMDADYCAHFIKTAHMLATPCFHTLRIYDKIFTDGVSSLVFSCSDTEARNLGRFLRNILHDLKSWVEPGSKFLEETVKGTGSFLPGFQHNSWQASKPLSAGDVISKDQLLKLLKKWHMKLAVGLTQCIDGSEYMQIYNAIVILKEILPVLPRQDVNYAIGPMIHDCVKGCINRETREDLKVLAQAYLQHMLKVRDTWEWKGEIKKPAAASPRTPTVTDSKVRSTNATTSGASATSTVQRNGPAPAAPSTSKPPTATTPAGVAPSDPKASATKLALESIPRPEIVKRVPRNGSEGSPKPPERAPGERREERREEKPSDTRNGTAAPVSRPSGSSSLPAKPEASLRPSPNGVHHSPSRQPPSPLRQQPPPPPQGGQRREPPVSPRGHRPPDDHGRPTNQIMPPPIAPSSTTTAQDIRVRASRDDRDRIDSRVPSRGPPPPSRPRSPSPPTRRPSPARGSGRNGSQESLGLPRNDDRPRDGDRARAIPELPSRAGFHARDSLADPRDARDVRERPASRARDDDRGSDDRPRDRERHDAHHPRDREHASRDGRSAVGPPRPEDDSRGGDLSRRAAGPSTAPDESIGKRRRHGDDEPAERSSKRSGSSRHSDKEGGSHREREERSSRSHRRDKDRGDKDKDRDRRESSEKRSHRKDREGRDDGDREKESRPAETSEKAVDKTTRPSEPSASNGKGPAVLPSGPRAMAGPEAPRVNRVDASAPPTARPADSNRDNERGPSNAPATQPPASQPPQTGTPSLRDRLGGYQSSTPERSVASTSAKDEGHGENRGTKRGMAERTSGREPESESGTPPNKRLKIQRQRYPLNPGQLDKDRG